MTVDELITRHEASKSKPYTDTVGKITIGIGRNLTDIGLSDDEIHYLFRNDKQRAWDACAIYPWFLGLSTARQAACIDLAFNLGSLHGFPRFCLAMSQGNWKDAANELATSKWATQVGKRATDDINLILTETWP